PDRTTHRIATPRRRFAASRTERDFIIAVIFLFVTPGLVPRLSGSHFGATLESLCALSLSLLSSWPDLFGPSTCSFAEEEHVDARDKHGHDDSLELSATTSATAFTEPNSRGTSPAMTTVGMAPVRSCVRLHPSPRGVPIDEARRHLALDR